jgi:hypothetical protein
MYISRYRILILNLCEFHFDVGWAAVPVIFGENSLLPSKARHFLGTSLRDKVLEPKPMVMHVAAVSGFPEDSAQLLPGPEVMVAVPSTTGSMESIKVTYYTD